MSGAPEAGNSLVYRRRIEAARGAATETDTRTGLSALAMCALFALILALPPVVRATGVQAGIAVAACLTFGIYSVGATTLLSERARSSDVVFRWLVGTQLLVATGVTVVLTTASGDPKSPLFITAVLYASFVGASHELEPAWSVAALLAAGPLLSGVILHQGGRPAGEAFGGPLVFATLAFIAYHFSAIRAFRTRQALSERAAQLEELATLRAELERRDLARELHDGLGLSLALTAAYADLIANRLGHEGETCQLADNLARAAREGSTELRSILGAMGGGASSARGLASALEDLARQAEPLGLRTTVEVAGDVAAPLPVPVLLAVERAFREFLTNTLRHASATELQVELRVGDAEVALSVADNGCGAGTAEPISGRGLDGLRARAAALGGSLAVASATGAGTCATLRIPRIGMQPPPAG
jgi:signal transduction histidine kinase